MRVYLVGEGPCDIGGLSKDGPYRDTQPGFLQPILDVLIGQGVEFDGRKLSLFGKQKVKGLKDAMAAKANRAVYFAQDAGADVLVFVTDADKGAGKNTQLQAEKRMGELREMIEHGVEKANVPDLPTVIGIPCRTIESWALGDLEAVQVVAGGNQLPVLPNGKGPEELWGDSHDPASNHPKSVLARILDRPGGAEDLADIARHARTAELSSNCPLSFAPFRAEVEAVAGM